MKKVITSIYAIKNVAYYIWVLFICNKQFENTYT